jgi:hypothetical protein
MVKGTASVVDPVASGGLGRGVDRMGDIRIGEATLGVEIKRAYVKRLSHVANKMCQHEQSFLLSIERDFGGIACDAARIGLSRTPRVWNDAAKPSNVGEVVKATNAISACPLGPHFIRRFSARPSGAIKSITNQ